MSFWYRITQPKLKWQTLTRQFNRSYLQIPHHHSLSNPCNQTGWGFQNLRWLNGGKASDFCCNVRFFAAPVQAKSKKEEKDTSGPRMNDQIKAEVVRLVSDDGHEIVSRTVALERARKLKLDLVEVQRNAKPPVCKIMDFHREKYKKQVKEKDRAKSKSELSLRKGDCKEVRFSAKTEAKDLKMKADTVKRLMDRGYRVKCMAMGTEDQDLGGLLTRLSSLIEDVSFVESGPRVEKRQAYVIVRHIKFGPSKKGSGKKASKFLQTMSSEAGTVSAPMVNPCSYVESPAELEEESCSAESDLEIEDEVFEDEVDTPISPSMRIPDKTPDENKAAWSVMDANDDFDKVFNFTEKQTYAEQETASSDMSHDPRPVLDSTRMNSVPSTPVQHPPETLNRYRKSEPRTKFVPTTMDNHSPGATYPSRSQNQFLNQGMQAQSNMNSSHSIEETKQDRTGVSAFRNAKIPLNDLLKQEPSHSGPPSSQRSSYGAFSAPKDETPGKIDPFTNSASSESRFPIQGKQSLSDFNVGGTKQVPTGSSVSGNLTPAINNIPKPEQSRAVPPSEMLKQEPSHSGPPSSQRPSYGDFRAPKAEAPGRPDPFANSAWSESRFPIPGKQPFSDLNVGGSKQVPAGAPVLRNLTPPINNIPKPEQSRDVPPSEMLKQEGLPSSQRPSYGAFSALKAEAPGRLDPYASSARSESQFLIPGKQPLSDFNVGGNKQVLAGSSVSRNLTPPTNNIPKPEQSRPMPPSSSASGFGIFSAPKASTPEINRKQEGNPLESAKNPSVNQDGRENWGIFSREGSKVTPSRISESEAKVRR